MLQYEHEREEAFIGEGSYGSVYSCQSLGKNFALKKFHNRGDSTFIHESMMAIKTNGLNHVVQVKKSFISGENGYLLMEYCISDLFACISEKEFSESEALEIFYIICEAVAELHSRNIAHLDLKLENILLNPGGKWKLCDFGSACTFKKGDFKFSHRKIGTPGYSPPEIMEKKSFLPEKADSWSLGIILHALLLQCFPYLDSAVPSASSFSLNFLYFSQISASSKVLVMQLLSIDPHKRPSATEILRRNKTSIIERKESKCQRIVKSILKKAP